MDLHADVDPSLHNTGLRSTEDGSGVHLLSLCCAPTTCTAAYTVTACEDASPQKQPQHDAQFKHET